jgi:hypothetical protein
MRVAACCVIRSVPWSEAQRFAVVRNRAVDTLDTKLRPAAPGISASIAGLKPDSLGEIGDCLDPGPRVGTSVAAVQRASAIRFC